MILLNHMLELKNISKIYTNDNLRIESIKNLSLSVADREFIALIGPSGCGKSTLLRMIAGLIPATSGEIILNGKRITGSGQDRGLVPQSFTLFPWLTVKENISFGLDLQKLEAKKKTEIVNHYLEATGLKDFAEFYPKNLSGGMQQRVAIARTLANNPKILLMDEPFGSLDAQTRSQMQEFLTKLWESERQTIIFVTHDVGESIFLADTVYVLSQRPMEIKNIFHVPFNRPRTKILKQTKEFFEFKKEINQTLEQ